MIRYQGWITHVIYFCILFKYLKYQDLKNGVEIFCHRDYSVDTLSQWYKPFTALIYCMENKCKTGTQRKDLILNIYSLKINILFSFAVWNINYIGERWITFFSLYITNFRRHKSLYLLVHLSNTKHPDISVLECINL